MSVAKEGGLGGGGSGLYGRVEGFMWSGLQIMICKVHIRVQIMICK